MHMYLVMIMILPLELIILCYVLPLFRIVLSYTYILRLTRGLTNTKHR